jgi:hypothetical protein
VDPFLLFSGIQLVEQKRRGTFLKLLQHLELKSLLSVLLPCSLERGVSVETAAKLKP